MLFKMVSAAKTSELLYVLDRIIPEEQKELKEVLSFLLVEQNKSQSRIKENEMKLY